MKILRPLVALVSQERLEQQELLLVQRQELQLVLLFQLEH